MSEREVFTTIYKNNYWNSLESKSGKGSEQIQTKEIQHQIQLMINKYHIKSIADIACGDFNWMKNIVNEELSYCGYDIVEELITNNNKLYKKENIHFGLKDIIHDKIPTVDLIVCRDCFVHLSYNSIKKCLKNIKASKSKYLLTTSFTKHKPNFDIASGDWRALNLSIKPFYLVNPIDSIIENCTEDDGEFKDKSLLLFEIINL